MDSVCFCCGKPKESPLTACPACQKKPISRADRITAMCLSTHCLSEKNLAKASNHISKTGKIPGFHATVTEKATKLVSDLPDRENIDNSVSFDFSESFFEFKVFADDDAPGEKITVYAIGKPANAAAEKSEINDLAASRLRTVQKLEWEIGNQISQDEYDIYAETDNCLYVWYRWMGNNWNWKCITKIEFENLNQVNK